MTSSVQPGTRSHQDMLHQMIRVNQAGEYGAVQIYKGQLQVIKDPEVRQTIQHMLEQEKAHLDQFNQQMVKNKVRPTALSPLWRVAGFALGAMTGLLGKKAAMACTVAVEEVIDDHYKSQETYLSQKGQDQDLKDLITKCRQEELAHRDIGYAHGAEQALAYPLLSKGIKLASRTAIWLSKRL